MGLTWARQLTTQDSSLISVQNIKFRYPGGDFLLGIRELEIEAGEKVAMIGPSGSGKTTLLNLLAGILTPDSGQVFINGKSMSAANDTKRRAFRIRNIGFIFQDFGLMDYLNVMDNILHPYRISKALQLNNDVKSRARLLADQMGIVSKLNRHPPDLSQGERQRVAICRALLPEPKLILADEATGNLDPSNKRHILDLLFQAVTEHDATLLAVTHDQDLLHHFDRVVNFKDYLESESAL